MRKSFLLPAVAVLTLLLSCSGGGDKRDRISRISCLEDLEGLEVGVVVGSIGDIGLSADYPELSIHRYNNPALLFQAMEMGRIDVAYGDGIMAMDSHFKSKGMVTKFTGPHGGEVGFGFSYSNPDLCNGFNDFLKEIMSNGSYAEILSRWIVDNADSVRMPADIRDDEHGEPIHVGILGGNVPFAFVDANGFAGIEPELLERYAKRIGRSVVYHEYDPGSLIASLASDKVDIISAFLYKTEEREKSIMFSDTYYSSPMICFTCESENLVSGNLFTRIKNSFYNNIIAEERYELILEGLLATLLIAFLSILFGTILGALMCWRLLAGNKKIWHGILKVYGAIMHGVPLLVILMLMFYVVFHSSSISAVAVSIITFTIYFAYACCEIFSSGIGSVSRGQVEAARSLGMTGMQAFRFVIFPQAIKRIVPFYESEAVTLLKETCLVGFIAVVDLTKATDIIQSRTYDAFFPLLTAALIYFVLAWLLSQALSCLIKKKSGR